MGWKFQNIDNFTPSLKVQVTKYPNSIQSLKDSDSWSTNFNVKIKKNPTGFINASIVLIF